MCEELCEIFSDIKEGASVQIWGVGNALLGDDAVGGIIASRLGGFDCGTAPENYISKLRGHSPDLLLIFDAADLGENQTPGSVGVLRFEQMSGTAFTSHGVPLKMLLEPFAQSIKIYLVGIQPKTTELGAEMSEEVAAAAENLIKNFEGVH